MPLSNDRNKGGRRRLLFVVGLTVMWVSIVVAAGIVSAPGSRAQTTRTAERPASESTAYVSSAVCAECHVKEYEAWKTSHHAWALKTPTEASVLGDFDNAIFEHNGIRSRFFRRDGQFIVETDGPDGKRAEYEVEYTVGVEPLQQYLVQLDRGRLQALDVAWDTEQQRWFDLYPDQVTKPNDGLHWSGPYKNWNSRCAECHQTNFIKSYSPRTGAYQSQWSELTVSCESCHGPGETHARWAKEAGSTRTENPQSYQDIGLSVDMRDGGAEGEIGLCASCHSRRSPLGPDSPPPGSKFADHYQLALLREGLYHADGQIDDEVYVYGSFLQSRMYARGVQCSNCHEPHSGELVADDTNGVCAQCHSPAGNDRFPTLKKAVYDDPSHHRHTAGSQGSQCVNCHMPAKTYMRVDPRRDHSFRVPRPDLSATIGTPNACKGCHDDKKAAWAVAQLKKWFPDGRTGRPHYGEILHEGRTRSEPETAEKLIALALDRDEPAIVRASALDLLRRSITPRFLPDVFPLLDDSDYLIRSGALQVFQNMPVDSRVSAALRLLGDPKKSVRLEAAKLLIGVSLDGLSSTDQTAARNALAAYQRSLFARADYPETQMQIAGLAMTLRDFRFAEQALATATVMDPQLADAWLLRARIQQALRRPDRAQTILEQAALALPDNAVVLFELGALYSNSRDYAKAVKALEKNLQLSGPSPDLLDLLAANHIALGKMETARRYANELARRFPQHQATPLVRQLLEQEERRSD